MKLRRQFPILFVLCGAMTLPAADRVVPLDSGWQLPAEAKIVETGGKPTLTVIVPAGQGEQRQVAARRAFDLAPYRGHQVEFVYEVRATDVSRPRERWNGVKLMLHYKSENKDHYPNTPAAKNCGSYDWTTIAVPVYLKPDAKNGTLILGLESSSGKVEVRSVKIRDLGAIADPYPPPVSLPRGFRAQYTPRVTALPRLRGVMSPNSYKPEDLEDYAAWNGNLIRWQIKPPGWGEANSLRDIPKFRAWLRGELDSLEKVLAHCRKLGIKVAVDLHGAPGARSENGDLTMLHDKTYGDAFVDCWREIATRLKGHPAVWAYGIINEPQEYKIAPEGYLAIQYRAALAIREIDPDTPLLVTSNAWSAPQSFAYLHPLPLKDVIYEVHVYVPHEYTHQGIHGPSELVAYPGKIGGEEWNKDTLKKWLEPVRNFEKKYGARIYVGEFSVVRYAPGGAQYLEDLISIFEEYKWDWSYHAFRESHYWSVEHAGPDGANPVPDPDTDRKRVLLRAFGKNQK